MSRTDFTERNKGIVHLITAHPNATYTEIGDMCGISNSVVSKVARRHGVTRGRGNTTGFVTSRRADAYMTYEARKAARKCTACEILLDHLDPAAGIAMVDKGYAIVPVCSECVAHYPFKVEYWEKEPEKQPDRWMDAVEHCFDIATARWPVMEAA
jgi:hypothetical protein